MIMGENGYTSYQAMVSKVNTGIENLSEICKKLNLESHAGALEAVGDRLRNHVFRVGIMGEFKRGKSTVINALLGKEVVPADILPCSATLNRIVWDATPHARINFKQKENGVTPPPKEVSVEELNGYVTKLTTESEKQAGQVEDAMVFYPCKFCQNGVEIIDTPGLNDDERMDKISESVIPTLDAIIMVVVPGSPFGISEANFVRNKIMTSDLSRLIFVVNKIDTVRGEENRKRCVEGIRKKIEETVLEKMASMYGSDSEEYKAAQSKLGGIRIYPISAADALDGRLENDEELLKKSGMLEFENALTKLLTEERGMLELAPAVNTVISKVKQADKTIEMRMNAMNMEQAEFEKKQKEAMQKIKESREEKKRKVKEIKGAAASIYQELQPDVVAAYNELEQTVIEYIDNYDITQGNFANDYAVSDFQESVSAGINCQFEMSLQESTEKMQVKIQQRLSDQIEDLAVYEKNLSANIEDIQGIALNGESAGTVSKKMNVVDMVGIGVESVTNMIGILPGLGSAISGFREYGAKGAAVGLGTGLLATGASNLAINFALASLGVVAGPAVVVPLAIISGIVGTLGGKKITQAILGKKGQSTDWKQGVDIASVKNSLADSVRNNVNRLRAEHVLENWLKDVTDETFQSLSERLDRETEDVLSGLQETLTNIQVDLGKEKTHQEAVLDKLNDYREQIQIILQNIVPIRKKLDETLSRSA